jgi:TldD protein
MDSASRHADYADARFVQQRAEHLSTRNGELDELDCRDAAGIGIRVRLGGAWGFAAAGDTGRASAEAALERALAVARAQPSVPGFPLAPEQPARGSYASPVELDPFEVSLEEKLGVLLAADEGLRSQPGVGLAQARFLAFRTETVFASSEGALFDQTLTECGGGVAAVAVREGESQVRSYPGSHGGLVRQAGFEHFTSLELARAAPRVAEEAAALLQAPSCPSGRTTLILAGEQLELQVHESVGHAVELDRVLGREASYAGTSYAGRDSAGALRVGSPLMNVTADATTPGGLGSYRWDDEGVEAQAVPVVRDGVLQGFLSSRETAAEIGLPRSGGCMRAQGFARQPLVRMTNVNLEPGEAGTLDELVAATDSGLLIESNRSWSIDDRRLDFRFEGEAAWEIEGGERRRLVKNPSYAGVTPVFWSGLDAVCASSEWRLGSVINCGKGEPGQELHVSHGASPARFRDVEAGVR